MPATTTDSRDRVLAALAIEPLTADQVRDRASVNPHAVEEMGEPSLIETLVAEGLVTQHGDYYALVEGATVADCVPVRLPLDVVRLLVGGQAVADAMATAKRAEWPAVREATLGQHLGHALVAKIHALAEADHDLDAPGRSE